MLFISSFGGDGRGGDTGNYEIKKRCLSQFLTQLHLVEKYFLTYKKIDSMLHLGQNKFPMKLSTIMYNAEGTIIGGQDSLKVSFQTKLAETY